MSNSDFKPWIYCDLIDLNKLLTYGFNSNDESEDE